MPSFNIVLPQPLAKVVIQKAKPADQAAEETYRKAYEAGYRAGQLKAEYEAREEARNQGQKANELVEKLSQVHEEFFKITQQHLPQLVLAALTRVLQHHRFTDDEIYNEVGALLKDLSLAKSIAIECSRADMDELKQRLEAAGVALTQCQIQWTPNDEFQKGEYVIQSDLGVLDGRKSTRMSHIHAALQSML